MFPAASQKRNVIFFVLAASIVATGALSIGGLSFLLRPIADDYCHGTVAIGGFWTAVLSWWSTWTGDFSLIVFFVALIGLPLVWLPFGVSSSIAFLITGIVVGAVVVLALSLLQRLPWWRSALVWSTVTFSWWTALWARELVFPDGDNRALAEFLVHWQTVNVAYVLVPALNLIVFFALVEHKISKLRFSLFLIFFLGVLLGGSGLVWGATLGAFALLLAFGNWVLSGIRSAAPFFFYFMGAATGLFISISSPGASVRRQLLPELELPKAIFSAIRVAPQGIGNWLETVFSFQTLLVLGIGMMTAWFAGNQQWWPRTETKVLRLVLLLVPFSLLLATVSSIAQVVSYEALWHVASTQFVVFLWSMILGHYLYGRMKSSLLQGGRLDLQIWIGKMAILLTILGLFGAGTLGMSESIIERQAAWEIGDAPLLGAADRSVDWVGRCWENLQDHRTSVGRG